VGGRAAGLLCAHDCTVLWQSERREKERERGQGKLRRESVNIGSYMQKRVAAAGRE